MASTYKKSSNQQYKQATYHLRVVGGVWEKRRKPRTHAHTHKGVVFLRRERGELQGVEKNEAPDNATTTITNNNKSKQPHKSLSLSLSLSCNLCACAADSLPRAQKAAKLAHQSKKKKEKKMEKMPSQQQRAGILCCCKRRFARFSHNVW